MNILLKKESNYRCGGKNSKSDVDKQLYMSNSPLLILSPPLSSQEALC